MPARARTRQWRWRRRRCCQLLLVMVAGAVGVVVGTGRPPRALPNPHLIGLVLVGLALGFAGELALERHAVALPGKALTQYVVEHNLLERNLGYNYYDTAMNGVYGTANIALESITFEQMVSMRNRILALQAGSSQEETALRHGIAQHAPQRSSRLT